MLLQEQGAGPPLVLGSAVAYLTPDTRGTAAARPAVCAAASLPAVMFVAVAAGPARVRCAAVASAECCGVDVDEFKVASIRFAMIDKHIMKDVRIHYSWRHHA